MIRILLLDTWRSATDTFGQTWARSLEGRLRTVAYESLSAGNVLVGGPFIFSDLERLTDAQCAQAAALAATIESAGGRVLNQPSRVLRRHDLLRALYAAGLNPFNVFRPHELDQTIKFPVFLRHERQHTGAITKILPDMDELKRALDLHRNVPDLLIVEYFHTAVHSDKLFRKYAVLRVGQRLIPRNIHFSTYWVDKGGDTINDQTIAEEEIFLNNFSHAEQLMKVYDIAQIDYGRIEYSILNDKIVTWEINTNPTIMPPNENTDLRRVALQAESSRLIREGFLDLLSAKSVKIYLSESPRIVPSSDISKTRRWTLLLSNFFKRVARLHGGRRILEAIRRSINLAIDLDPPGPENE